ncbi:MAG TPA: lipopolysaccharide biosynthesis protein [Candidatus Alectryocaccobium stercorigallinarum]|nr:lipopolysaccharide biosynthesis protein [Candidatus Alectryocaccobium stercorigallinarum]
MLQDFLIRQPKDLARRSVVNNLAASLLNASVSVVLLLVVTRFCGTSDAGVFSLGFSTAQMMLPIGQYGMRFFQASDVLGKYDQKDYVASRVITNLIMMAGAVGFVLVRGYYLEKALILIVLCLLKVTDAFDDVYGGYYQLNNRLDISGKMQFIRIALYCAAFVAVVGFTRDTLAACWSAVAVSAVSLIIMVAKIRKLFPEVKPVFRAKKIRQLLIDCLPLCIGAFLVLYMGNAPKYAIDAYMQSEYQAIYNYLFMPCYVISLFMNFVLQPLILKMSKTWVREDYKSFGRICALILGAAAVLSIVIIAVGHFLGCPVLGWLYGVDLSGYQYPFTVLLVGGAGYALSIILQTILTVMRHQYIILVGYALSSVLVTFQSSMWVRTDGITGAAYSYVAASGVLFAALLVSFITLYKKESKGA